MSVVKCPALQVLHDDHPLFVPWYFPDSQAMQSFAPGPAAVVLVEYRPAAHGPLQEPDVAPAAPYLPHMQFSQVESPFELYLPAGQSLQCVAPFATPLPSLSLLEVAVKCPAGQLAHVVSAHSEHASLAYWPAPQVEHCVHRALPPPTHAELVYWPAPHVVHGEH